MAFGQHSSLIMLFAGVSFFMFGMTLASEHLHKLAANHVRKLIGRISKSHFLAINVGIALTVLLQSSGAVTSMLVGMGSAGVIKLQQVMGVIIGTAIGTTLTVQLISFNIAQYGLPIFAISFMVYFMSSKRVLKHCMGVCMGFGMIFLGIEFIGAGAKIFQELKVFSDFFSYLGEYPLATVLVATALSGFVHSSAVTIGFAMSLTGSGVIDLNDALYWVYGANVGTASTALMASLGGNYVGRQVAWAHLFYKLISVALFFGFTGSFAHWLSTWGLSDFRNIANAHTIYNILTAIFFFPFINVGARWIQKLFPPSAAEKEFGVKYLSRRTYESVTLATSHARRELMRMSDIVQSMIRDSILLFKEEDPELLESIRERDNKVDHLHREINMFLVKFSNESKEGVAHEVINLISYCSDLESAADVVDKSIAELARKKLALKIEFSEFGWEEIESMHREVVELVAESIACFQLRDAALAEQTIERKRAIRKLERKLRESHIERLNQGLRETINTSSIHLDLMSEFRRITSLIANHVYPIAKRESYKEIIEP